MSGVVLWCVFFVLLLTCEVCVLGGVGDPLGLHGRAAQGAKVLRACAYVFICVYVQV